MKGSNGGSETILHGGRRDACLAKIQKLEKDRADRRNKLEKARADRVAEEARNIANGNPGDADFMGMIKAFRNERAGSALPHVPSGNEMKICIAIRKRPTNSKERARKDHDAVSCFNPEVTVHDCKLRVDGISKYLDNVGFRFDQAFGEEVDNQLVYDCTAKPLVPFVLNRGRATVFAYGQTGSGKTYTMLGIQKNATDDLFDQLVEMPRGDSLGVFVSFFEIYGGHCQDLLNGRKRVVVREDGKGEVVIAGLEEKEAVDAEGLEELIADGNRNRTTHATESNDQSSRSHAICQISIRNVSTGRLHGKLSLIDLAGSERGADTKSHDRQRRVEGGDINKSLLALKECIRALDSESVHVPYRASKLTLVLKDSFTRKGARTVMIATVSPGASSADHTINTLRYADRVKENKVEEFRPGANRRSPSRSPPAAPVEDVRSSSSQDQPPLPPSALSCVPSSRSASSLAASSASAAVAGNDGVGGGLSTSQRRQIDRRRGGGIWSETASGAGTGGAETGLYRRVASELRSTRASASNGGVSLDPRHPQSKAGPSANGGGMRIGTPTRRSSSFSSHRRSSSMADGSKRCPGSPTAAPAESIHPSLETPLDHGGQGKLRSRLVLGKERAGGRMKVVGGFGDLAKEGRRLYASPSPERGESVGGRHGANLKSADLDIVDSDVDYKPESVLQSQPVEDGEERTLLGFSPAMESLRDEENTLMHMHMDIIEENTKLLAEEGLLLQACEREGVNQREMDRYANRLSEIVHRKMTLMSTVRNRFRSYLDYLETEQCLIEKT